jgi:hypothetical protein
VERICGYDQEKSQSMSDLSRGYAITDIHYYHYYSVFMLLKNIDVE